MTMTGTQELRAWRGHTVIDADGDKIGKVADIYFDEETDQPEWLAVSTGLFGTRVSFVPLAGATARGDDLAVPFTKETVKDAPNADPDGHLSPEEEERLYRHYGLDYSEAPASGGPGRDTSGPNTDDAMTRSEEELRVGTTSREAGRVRLRKWVDTEEVSQTVPVAREEVRIEREPVTDANVDRALDGPEISEEEHEVTLHEEQVVAAKQAVPKERVRLDTEVVTEEQTVAENLRKERIDVEGDVRR
jgi:uncharacterized protein (TIGR02271 family)